MKGFTVMLRGNGETGTNGFLRTLSQSVVFARVILITTLQLFLQATHLCDKMYKIEK